MITEIIEFELKEGIKKEQLLTQVDKVAKEFHNQQEGYVDMELISDFSGKSGQMIMHYQSMENIEKLKVHIPNSKVLKDFRELIIPESMKVSFFEKSGKWLAN